MKSKKDIIFNLFLFGGIVSIFLILNFLTTPTPIKTVSFEGKPTSLPLLLPPNPTSPSPSPFTFRDLRGENFLVHFWASWCKSCEGDFKYLKHLKEELKNSPVKFVIIASEDKPDAILKIHSSFNGLGSYIEPTGALAKYLGIKSLPETLLINTQGQILTHIKGPLNENTQELLKEKSSQLKEPEIGILGFVPEFKLISSNGRSFSRENLKNKVWVIDFIFTKCPAQCPMMSSRMKELQNEFGSNPNFNLVSVSVDPNHDRPPILKSYSEKYQAKENIWHFLTGSFGSVKKLIGRGFKLGTPEDPQLHTSKFVLVDSAFQIRGYYESTIPSSMAKLKNDIPLLLKIRNP